MKRALMMPEVQFFLIFFSVLLSVFLINRVQLLEPDLLFINGVFFVVLFFVSFLQMLYGLHIRNKNLEEEKSFLRMAAHQMRTPATAVTWMLEELRQPDLKIEERDRILDMGLVATQKFISIIDVFSQLPDIEAGKPEYRFEEINLNNAVLAAVSETAPISYQYGIKLDSNIQTERMFMKADSVKFEIVLSNLIHNAIKYNKEGGSVMVYLRRKQGEKKAEIIVEDTGIGIPTEDMPYVFDLFFRSKAARKLNPTGTGLGLSLVRNILDHHHGNITVSSQEGRGTKFTVTVPLSR